MSKRRIIFLDIDGVLNCIEGFEREECNSGIRALVYDDFSKEAVGFYPPAVARLKAILEETQAEIVVMSTWRLGLEVVQLQAIFNAYGIHCIADKTPESQKGWRGSEVQMWLDQNDGDNIQWITIDDDGDFTQLDRHIRADHTFGLRDIDVEKAIMIFKENER